MIISFHFDCILCSKERDLHIQQVQHDFSKRRTVDEVKLKLEAVIKKKILLEAIHDTLQV